MPIPSRLSLLILLCQLVGCGSVADAAPDAGVPLDAEVGAPVDAEPDVPPDAEPDAPAPPASRDERVADRAFIKWLSADANEPWWLDERIAPQPVYLGDRDLGPRSIVRGAPDRRVVWTAPEADRLTDAVRHPSGEWSAVGVQTDYRVFIAHGNASGLIERIVLEDPELATDNRAWGTTPRTVLRTNPNTESSVTIVADGEEVVVALQSEDYAVLSYRFRREGGTFVRSTRTLVSPSRPITPFLPIGGSYDDFDNLVQPYSTKLGVDATGRVFVAIFADQGRILRHNTVFGTKLSLLRSVLGPRENTSDALVAGVDRDGRVAFATVIGIPDNEDEVFGFAVGDGRLAVLGRHRRELGRDNTELHVTVAELTREGVPLVTTAFDTVDSGLAQTGAYIGSDLYVGGTEGWVQNPSGRSLFESGQPFLIRVRGDDAPGKRTTERLDRYLPRTSGHAELRAIAISGGKLFLGGLENGPLTHSGDADPSMIRSDAYFTIQPL